MSLPTPSTPLDQRDPIFGANRAQPAAISARNLRRDDFLVQAEITRERRSLGAQNIAKCGN
jgi:hypothetical protein